MSQSIPGKPVFPALPRLSSRGSTHTTVARGTALWESLVGKLEGKPQIPGSTRREVRHCCYSSEGKCTCIPPLETRTDSPGETPEVPQDPCQHWRGILRFRHRLHTRSEAPASTGEESREAPEQLAWGLAFPVATRAGHSGPRHKSRAPDPTQENSGGSALHARCGPFPLRRLEANHI